MPSTKTNASPARSSARRWGCKEACRRQSLAYALNGLGIVSLSAGSLRHLSKIQRCADTLRGGSQPLKACASAGSGVHCPIQHGLGGAGGVQAGVQRQHVLPGPVEERHLPPPVGAGEPHFTRRLQIRLDLRRGKAGGGQAVGQAGAEQPGQVGPELPRHIKADKGVPAVAVHGQQAVAAPQLDDVQIPAEVPASFAAVGRWLLVQKPLQGKGQSQFHQFTSWGMRIFSTWMAPPVTSARIRVIS